MQFKNVDSITGAEYLIIQRQSEQKLGLIIGERVPEHVVDAKADEIEQAHGCAVDEEEKGAVVPAADARAQPRAVVVEALHAVVARCAVHGAGRAKDAAGVAKAQADHKPVDNLLLLLLDGSYCALWVGCAAWNDAGVSASSGPKRSYGNKVKEDSEERHCRRQQVQCLGGGAKEEHGGNADDGESSEAVVDFWPHHEAALAEEPVRPLPRVECDVLRNAATMLGRKHFPRQRNYCIAYARRVFGARAAAAAAAAAEFECDDECNGAQLKVMSRRLIL